MRHDGVQKTSLKLGFIGKTLLHPGGGWFPYIWLGLGAGGVVTLAFTETLLGGWLTVEVECGGLDTS